jgi:hypothetical protein
MRWRLRRSQAGHTTAPTFVSNRQNTAVEVRFRARAGVSDVELRRLSEELEEVPWSDLHHAYGPATDVPALLYAATLGDDMVRREAWWELWGNVHHQGTVYEATVPAVRFIASIAASGTHPDRVEAISFLRQIVSEAVPGPKRSAKP